MRNEIRASRIVEYGAIVLYETFILQLLHAACWWRER